MYYPAGSEVSSEEEEFLVPKPVAAGAASGSGDWVSGGLPTITSRDMDLKTQHSELKQLQKTVGEGQGLYERKKQMLEAKTKECRRLEEDRKVIPSSQKLSDTIDVF